MQAPPRSEKTSAALLILFTLVAIVWANSPIAHTYLEFWSSTIDLRVGAASIELTFREVVNDALMTFFFLTVGLEVKREFTIGELTDRSRALVPISAALAGLIIPALVFLAVNPTGENAHFWGIVISTDTAFLVGALAIAGPKFPTRLRLFLLTLAVVDDVGALIVIAVFYTNDLQFAPLLLALICLLLVALVRFLRAGRGFSYAVLAVIIWFSLLAAGVHPTLTGVALALLIPVFPPKRLAVERVVTLTRAFEQSPSSHYARAATRGLRESISISERLHSEYAPYVAYIILPIFALSNAGVRLDGQTLAAAAMSPLTWGIVAGLVAGKLIGITAVTAILRALHVGQLAPGLTVTRVAGGAAFAGIGFTISLLIVDIAIADPVKQDEARVGVLAASVAALLLGWAIFRIVDWLTPPTAIGRTLVRPVDARRDHIMGSSDAPLTLVEYGDFECSFCSHASGSIDEIRTHFGADLRYVWRHLPMSREHPHALEAAYASEAAALHGKFFELLPVMFSHQDRLEGDDLCTYAAGLGLDTEQFVSDLRSAHVANRVSDDILDAELMDLNHSPTFFIGEDRHHGPYDAATLIQALEASRSVVPGVDRSN